MARVCISYPRGRRLRWWPLGRRATFALSVLLLLAGLVFVLREPVVTHAKVVLLLADAVPQVPVKPLQAFSAEPGHEQVHLEAPDGQIVGDLFRPAGAEGDGEQRPALILALGIRLAEKDRPVLFQFAGTMARLGFVVLWPRRAELENGATLPELPGTFVAGFHHLESLDSVVGDRISMLGFSVGASTALVAASDARIAERVRAVIFFGGYYDILDYFVSLATATMALDDRIEPWQPEEEAVGHTRALLEAEGLEGVRQIFDAGTREEAQAWLDAAPQTELAKLRRLSPAAHAQHLGTRVFILHDSADRFVPYVGSVKLRRALPAEQVGAFELTGLFEHAQPKGGLSWDALGEVARVYGFVYEVLSYL
jgi:hypothetical protein